MGRTGCPKRAEASLRRISTHARLVQTPKTIPHSKETFGPEMRKGSAVWIKLVLAALAVWLISTEAPTRPPPLRNPVLLNIGFICNWQSRCISRQQRAMKSALSYTKKYRPPIWKVQVCNRNSSRNGTRKDWIGFNNCIRNPAIRPPDRRRQDGRRL